MPRIVGWILLIGLLAGGDAQPIVVRVLTGSELFEQSRWVRANLGRGTSGWVLGEPFVKASLAFYDRVHTPYPPTGVSVRWVHDADFAFGIRAELPNPLPESRVGGWVIELGEVARVRAYAPWCTAEQAHKLHQRAWAHIDTLLKRIASHAKQKGKPLWVIGVGEGAAPLHAFFALGNGTGMLKDPLLREPMLVRADWLTQGLQEALQQGATPEAKTLIEAPSRWHAKQATTEWGRRILFGLWGVGLLMGALGLYRRESVSQHGSVKRGALIRDSAMLLAMVALGVASLFPAGWPHPTPILSVLTVIIGLAMLIGLGRMIDTVEVALGAIAGLGMLALLLDSHSQGVWNRDGLLGFGVLNRAPPEGLSEAHAGLMLGWLFLLALAWVRIEANPIGLVYGLGLLCVWMGWRAGDGVVATATGLLAGGIGGTVLCREMHSRRQARIALQNRPTRTVGIPSERCLLGVVGAFFGMVGLGLLLGWWRAAQAVPVTLRWETLWLLGAGSLLAGVGWRRRLWQTVPSGFRWVGWGTCAVCFAGLRLDACALLILAMVLAILEGER
ncbi:MAG: hypothetical protein C4337_00605 [Armatimonadota bacterium]